MFVFLVIGIPLLVLLFVIHQKQSDKLNGFPPGPIRWPIIGSLPQMLMIHPTASYIQFDKLREKYGDIFSVGVGIYYTVGISSYEAIKDVFKRTEATKRFRFDFIEQRDFGKNLGIIWAFGEDWKEQRKYTFKRLREFGFGKKLSMEDTIRDEVDLFLSDVYAGAKEKEGIWEVEQARISTVQINILWASVGGYRFDPAGSQIKRHLQINNEMFETLGPKNILAAFPFLKIFPELSGYNRNCELHKKCHDFIRDLIKDAKERREGRSEPESFVEFYLDDIEKNKENQTSRINEEQLMVTLMDLFLGGSDTTSSLMLWVFLYLALYPNIQRKLRDEILKESNGGTQIPLIDRHKMTYFRAFVTEAMRHAPFIPSSTPREAVDDIVYEKHRIPKGTSLFINFYSLFHEKEYWGDADVFRPERFFLEDGVTVDAERIERVLQFGLGARVCPGEALAMDVVFTLLVRLLSQFSLGVVGGMEPSLELGKPSLILKPSLYSVRMRRLEA